MDLMLSQHSDLQMQLLACLLSREFMKMRSVQKIRSADDEARPGVANARYRRLRKRWTCMTPFRSQRRDSDRAERLPVSDHGAILRELGTMAEG